MKLANKIAFKSIFFQIVIRIFVGSLNIIIKPTSSELTFVFETILSQVLVYFTDILFIQEHFMRKGLEPNSLMEKFMYSLDRYIVYKFIVIVGISTIINTSIYNYIVGKMDERKLLIHMKSHRNLLALILVNVFATISYVNIMKFKWAYINNEDPILNMIIVSWFSLSILISVSKCQ
jgi:hypothetical protein